MLLATTTETALWLAAVLLVPLFVLGVADTRVRRGRGAAELPTTVATPDALDRSQEEAQAREQAVVGQSSSEDSAQGESMGSSVPH